MLFPRCYFICAAQNHYFLMWVVDRMRGMIEWNALAMDIE